MEKWPKKKTNEYKSQNQHDECQNEPQIVGIFLDEMCNGTSNSPDHCEFNGSLN